MIGKILLACVGIISLILICRYRKIQVETYEYCEDYVMLQEIPSLLDFYYYSEKEWEEMLAEQKFGEVLTQTAVKWILEQTGSDSYITYTVENEKQAVTRAEWNQIYDKLLDLLDEEQQIRISDEVILKRDGKKIVSNTGTYLCDTDYSFIKPMTAVTFYIKGEDIIGIRNMQSESASISNVYVLKADDKQVEFLSQGEHYTLSLVMDAPDTVVNHVCDLLWENGSIAKVKLKEDTIQGNLIAVTDDSIEIEGYGAVQRSVNLPVYKTYGTVEQKALSDIVIANMKVEYVVAEDRVEAILLKEPAQISRIRVLLLADDGGPYRPDVYIGANTPYQIDIKGQSTEQSAEAVIKASDLFAGTEENSIQLKASQENGELFLCDESGKRLSKGYEGVLELHRYPDGMTVVNELSVEQYLCAVVPSEMPSSYGAEALKAQAVCARSYTYIQLERGDYAALGAHVDDSTNYQAYNKQDRDEKTTAAVLDTAGMVINYAGRTAEAYYFSTSAGITGNGDCWNLTADPSYAYLNSTQVKEGGGTIDLSSDQAFEQFLAEPDGSSYEVACPYFRWQAQCNYTSDECQKKISGILSSRKEKTPDDILYYDKENKPLENRKDFGNLIRIQVTKRSSCGAVLQLRLEYEKGTVLVGNEYSIRIILGTGLKTLTLADGTEKKDTTVLPSAFCSLTPIESGDYVIKGGGYGHGIGMSQNGAAAMAEQGKTFEQILNFYFQNIEIIQVS